jgi:SpoIIAA-like
LASEPATRRVFLFYLRHAPICLPPATVPTVVISYQQKDRINPQEHTMITIEQKGNLLNVAVLGEFTLADFKEFEEDALYKLKTPGPLNLVFDLRAMISYTVDVAWEEIKFFSREHQHDFSKIAVVTDDQWLTWQAWLSRLFVDADIRVFADYSAAKNWVAA